VTVLNFAREEVTEEIELGDRGKDAAEEWHDIVSGQPGGSARGGRLTVRVPALSGTMLIPASKR
jgi:hypothetical protein